MKLGGDGSSSSLISVRNLDKTYERGGEVIHVLQGLNLDVDKGDFVAFMGPSGSGKTTLLNLLGGLDVPSSGSIRVAGDEITRLSGKRLTQWRARHVGFIFQMYNLIPVLSGYRNVELPLLLTPLSKAERKRHVDTTLALVGLSDRAQHFPRQLSGGQQQRVAIARAIVADPTFLLCDEPTGDLDRRSADEILALIEALVRQHGKTVLMVTHDPRAAERAQTVLHLEKGVLVEGQGQPGVKYLPLIVANLLRKKIRTTLTLGSFLVALFLYGILVAVRGAFNQGVEMAGLDRLVVTNKISIIQPLPLAYRERLLRIPGVKQVTDFSWFGGVYQDEKNFFPQFAFDHETFREVFPEFLVPADQWQALLADKAGAIAGAVTAKRFGWKVGDRVPIRATYYRGTWEFNLVGIYKGSRPQDDESWFLFRRDHLDEKVPPERKGLTGWYYAKLADPNDALRVTKAIDEQFANSTWETRTQTEKEMALSFAKSMGNIEFLILAIGSVVFFTLLLVSGNTMAIAVRERVGELAVMKAVGYGDGFVLGLVMFESMLIALLGGGTGLLLAKAFSMRGDPTGGMLPVFYIPTTDMALGFALTAVVGAVAGVLPAFSASRLRVIEALRRL